MLPLATIAHCRRTSLSRDQKKFSSTPASLKGHGRNFIFKYASPSSGILIGPFSRHLQKRVVDHAILENLGSNGNGVVHHAIALRCFDPYCWINHMVACSYDSLKGFQCPKSLVKRPVESVSCLPELPSKAILDSDASPIFRGISIFCIREALPRTPLTNHP